MPAGSTVYLYTNSTVDQTTTVPDVTGKTGSFAKQMLQAASLNVQIEGDAAGRVVSQNVAADSSVPMGTVVTIVTGSDAAAEETETTAEPEGEASQEAGSAGEETQPAG